MVSSSVLQLLSPNIETLLSLDRLKSQGKSGLLYAIEKRTVMNVNVTLCAPKIILPENGNLSLGGPLIVADLGGLINDNYCN